MKALIWHDEQLGAKFDERRDSAEDARQGRRSCTPQLVEMAVEEDETLLEAYLERQGCRLSTSSRRCIRKGAIAFHFVPVMCGSAFKNKGVQPLARRRRRLSAVAARHSRRRRASSPARTEEGRCVPPTTRRRSPASRSRSWTIRSSARSPSCASIRARSRRGTGALNSVKDKNERVGRMLLMHANSREDVKEAYAGDIVAFAGLKYTTTGETLCDPNNPVILERMEFPDPVIEVAIEPKTKADQEKMGMALARLAQEDPSFRVSTDQESGQTILKGMGELHLEIKVDILKPHLQGRRQCRRAAGRLSRNAVEAGHDQVHAQEADRRFGPVRRSEDRIRTAAAGLGLRVRERRRRRLDSEGIHSVGGKGPQGAEGIAACSPASR